MCRQCSVFVTFLVARRLINPAFAAGYDLSTLSTSLTDNSARDNLSRSISAGSGSGGSGDHLGSKLKSRANHLVNSAVVFLRKTTADTGDALSVGTSLVNAQGDAHLRVCPRCKQLLERRDAVMDARLAPPIVVEFYERLRQLIEELSRIYSSYCRTADSLK